MADRIPEKDWLRLRLDLWESPKLELLADELVERGLAPADEFQSKAVALAVATRLWSAGRRHTDDDGEFEAATPRWLDRRIGFQGATEALVAVGWVVIREGGITLPEWEIHNSLDREIRQSQKVAARLRKQAQREAEKARAGATRSGVTCHTAVCDMPQTPVGHVRVEERRGEETRGEETPPSGGCGGDAGSSDRLTVLSNSQAPRWSRAEGLFLPASAIAGLRKAFPDADLEAMLAGWDAWRQGEDGLRARNPMGSIESWIRNRSGAVAAGEVVPVLSDEEELAIIRAADA